MQTNLEGIKSNKFPIFCLLGVVFVVVVSNLAGSQTAAATTDILYVPVSGGLLILSVIIAIKFKGKGETGKAYLLFVTFVSFWFAAEVVWLRSELFFHLVPFPKETDWLYLAGYPFLFAFMIYYLKPFRIAISKKMIWNASLATMIFFVPTIYGIYAYNPAASLPDILWEALYPLSDAMVLFPAVLGVSLFLKGKVNLLWSLCSIAIILNIMADSGFLFLATDNSVHSGNPINILYMWAYILFAFGIYSHVKLLIPPKMKSFGKIDDLK